MLSPQALIKGLVSMVLPSKTLDGAESEGAARLNEYREVITPLSRHGWAKEGTYFATANPTLGTTVAGAVLAAFAATTAAFVFQNTADPSNPLSKNIDLDLIKLAYTIAPATATGMEYAVVLDNVSRVPSAAFALLTPGQVGKIINSTIAKVWAFTGGAFMTVPAAGPNVRTVARGSIPGLPVIGTEHMIRFGTDGASSTACVQDTPISISPGWFAVVYLWWPGNATTGPSMEYLLGHVER
jgi:hypothetical protein